MLTELRNIMPWRLKEMTKIGEAFWHAFFYNMKDSSANEKRRPDVISMTECDGDYAKPDLTLWEIFSVLFGPVLCIRLLQDEFFSYQPHPITRTYFCTKMCTNQPKPESIHLFGINLSFTLLAG